MLNKAIMKKLSLLSIFLFSFSILFAQDAQTPEITRIISFKELNHDFGKIPFGKPVEFDMEMKNISNDTVRIENVQVSCGCTSPKWEPGPYKKGETFKVGIGFNGATDGEFEKIVTIFFNNGLSQVIKFHGQTFKTPDNPAPANAAIMKLKSANNN